MCILFLDRSDKLSATPSKPVPAVSAASRALLPRLRHYFKIVTAAAILVGLIFGGCYLLSGIVAHCCNTYIHTMLIHSLSLVYLALSYSNYMIFSQRCPLHTLGYYVHNYRFCQSWYCYYILLTPGMNPRVDNTGTIPPPPPFPLKCTNRSWTIPFFNPCMRTLHIVTIATCDVCDVYSPWSGVAGALKTLARAFTKQCSSSYNVCQYFISSMIISTQAQSPSVFPLLNILDMPLNSTVSWHCP